MAPDPLAGLIRIFRADPGHSFTADQWEVIQQAASGDLWAAKAVALREYRERRYEQALLGTRSIWERERQPENLKNLAVCLREMKQHSEAIEILLKNGHILEDIVLNDLLCSLYRAIGDIENAVKHGERTLYLKDKDSNKQSAPEQYIIRPFKASNRSRNVVSFSIWGSHPRYLNGAITNSIVCRYLYPGWTPRFYADPSLPEAFLNRLTANGAKVVLVTDLPAARYGLFWRFLVEDDEEVDIYIIRDADSVVNIKEAWAVTDWLRSDAAFHVMRDSPQHSELILAGMWGAHRGNIGNMRNRIIAHVEGSQKTGNDITSDQRFLRREVWPIMRHSLVAHDSFFNFMCPRRYPPEVALPGQMHVGQNDWVNFRRHSPGAPP